MSADPAEHRLIRRLAAAGARIHVDASGAAALHVPGGAHPVRLDADLVRRLLARGALARDPDGGWRLSDGGRATARRLVAGGDMAAQHQERAIRVVEHEGRRASVTVDLNESPLAWLRARKGRDGAPLIDDAAFAAGERLRADFTRGQLMPSITANWSLAGGAARGGGHAGGIGELTDAALGARLRVERALDSLGPELAGAVLDFCCFLKGIEQIESERGWPQRSAKLVLRLGLAALARHYGLDRVARGADPREGGRKSAAGATLS